MSKIEVGNYVKLIALKQQATETEYDFETLSAIYGAYEGQVGEVIALEDAALGVRFTDGEEFDVYPNEIELVEE